jgi:hypothetical protein
VARQSREALSQLLEEHGFTVEVLRQVSFVGLLGAERGRRDLEQRPPTATAVVLKDRLLVPALGLLERRLELPTADSLLVVARR